MVPIQCKHDITQHLFILNNPLECHALIASHPGHGDQIPAPAVCIVHNLSLIGEDYPVLNGLKYTFKHLQVTGLTLENLHNLIGIELVNLLDCPLDKVLHASSIIRKYRDSSISLLFWL